MTRTRNITREGNFKQQVEEFVKEHPEIKDVKIYNYGKVVIITMRTGEQGKAVRGRKEPLDQPLLALHLAYHRAMEKYLINAMESNARTFVESVKKAHKSMTQEA